MTDDRERDSLRAVLCDVCGRDNPDRLTFCQDCGKRLKVAPPKAVSPTPPQGLKAVKPADAPAAPTPAPAAGAPGSASPTTPGVSRPSTPPDADSSPRRSRPEAPAFLFGPRPSADPLGVLGDKTLDNAQNPGAFAMPASVAQPAPAAPKPAASSTSAVCATCGATNPANYKYCVTCGGNVRGPAPSRAPAAAPVPPAAAQATIVSASEPPGPRADAIHVAPVVAIADVAQPAEATTRCARCQGICPASARFCKYCGADLASHATNLPRQVLPAMDGSPAAAAPPPPAPKPAPAAPPPPPSRPRAQPAPIASDPLPQPVPAPPPPAPSPVAVSAAPGTAPVFAGAAAASNAAAAALKPTRPIAAKPTKASEPPPSAPAAGSVAGATTFVGTTLLGELEPPLGHLVVLVEDGSEGRTFDLTGPQVDIGRTEGDIILSDDPYVSPRHARMMWSDGRWVVRDLGSANGVYARIQGAVPLESGDLILLGLQVLQFQAVSEAERGAAAHRGAVQHGTKLFGSRPVERLARLDQRTIEGVIGDVYYVFREETFIGREVGDIVFTHDPFLSRRHAVIRCQKDVRPGAHGRFTIEDLGSSNGTYVGVRRDTPLANGDRIRIGQHLFRLDVEGAEKPRGRAPGSNSGAGHDPKRAS